MCKEKYVPKIGEVCEVAVKSYPWCVKKIMHIGNSFLVVHPVTDGCVEPYHEQTMVLRDCSFRKIQTEEEKFVEAYVRVRTDSSLHMFDNVARQLYNAGFRYVGEGK